MMDLKRLIRTNKSICAMLLCIVFFYTCGSLFWHLNPGKEELKKETAKTARMSQAEISQKEEVFKKNIEKNPALFGGLSLLFLLALSGGLAANIYVVRRKMKGLPVIPGGISLGEVPWGLREVFEVFVFLVFFEALIVFIEFLAGRVIDIKHIDKDLLLFINNLIRDLGLVVFLISIVRSRFGRPLEEMGLTVRNFSRNVLIGAGGYVSIVPALTLMLFILALVAQFFSYEPPPQPVVEIYLKKSSDQHLLFFTFFVAVAGPFVEEMFFRGFIYRALRGRFGIKLAMIFSAAIFGALHMNFFKAQPFSDPFHKRCFPRSKLPQKSDHIPALQSFTDRFAGLLCLGGAMS